MALNVFYRCSNGVVLPFLMLLIFLSSDARVWKMITYPTEHSWIISAVRGTNEVSMWNLETDHRQMVLWASNAPPLSCTQTGHTTLCAMYAGYINIARVFFWPAVPICDYASGTSIDPPHPTSLCLLLTMSSCPHYFIETNYYTTVWNIFHDNALKKQLRQFQLQFQLSVIMIGWHWYLSKGPPYLARHSSCFIFHSFASIIFARSGRHTNALTFVRSAFSGCYLGWARRIYSTRRNSESHPGVWRTLESDNKVMYKNKK
jgi:hypothetical protein